MPRTSRHFASCDLDLAGAPRGGRRAGRLAVLLGLAASLAACTLGPDFLRPDPPREQGYTTDGLPKPEVPNAAEVEQRVALGKKISGEWWMLFHSEPLDQLVHQAIEGNHSLAAAKATLAQARETVRQAAGGLYPQVDLGAGAARQHFSFETSGVTTFAPTTFNLYSVGPTVSYALDVFGEVKRSVEQQQALAEVQDYQLDAAYLAITGNVVMEAVVMGSLRAQIRAVHRIIDHDQANLDMVRKAYGIGEVSQVDVESARSQLTADEARLPPLRQQMSQARHALALLVGKSTGSWLPPDFDLAEFTLPKDLPLSLPSELVRQRPDVLAAEARLHAASAAVGVATAQLYPNITLSAGASLDSLSVDQLFNHAQTLWNFGSGLTAPLFHGGTLEARKRGAEDALDATFADYKETVVASFAQVADVLQALTHDAELLSDQRAAIEAAESTLRLTRLAYGAGSVAFLQVLDAERLYEQALLGSVIAETQQYMDTAQLFVAMGGGWWDWRAAAGTAPGKPG